jgi:hypothetical protein
MARHALAAVLVLGCAAHLVAGYPAFFYSVSFEKRMKGFRLPAHSATPETSVRG